MKHQELTGKVIACAFDVINELGVGFLESVYEKALMIALDEAGVFAESQKAIRVSFRSQTVGEFYADVLVEDQVLLELKAVKTLLPEHQAQIINYLKATGIEVGLLINFGNANLEFRRFNRGQTTCGETEQEA